MDIAGLSTDEINALSGDTLQIKGYSPHVQAMLKEQAAQSSTMAVTPLLLPLFPSLGYRQEDHNE